MSDHSDIETSSAGTQNVRSRAPVLIVDDEPDIRECLCEVLEMEGYSVVAAEDGGAALLALSATRPRLVILDLNMPRMDGHEFLRIIRADPRWHGLPVVVMTAGKALAPEANARLQKPCEVGALLQHVARYCPEGGDR